MQNFRPPSLDGQEAPAAEQASADEKLTKLVAYLHLPIEWCDSCRDWRDDGHSERDTSGHAGVVQAMTEEQDYPTIG